jgi:hypothetical protein
MGLKTKFALVAGIVLVLAFAFFLFNGSFTGEVVNVHSESTDKFISCLNEKGVVMYGFTNNPSVNAQLGLFGVDVMKLNVIDCHANPTMCEGVIIYPSWKVDGRIISSGLSLGMLSDLSGCKL